MAVTIARVFWPLLLVPLIGSTDGDTQPPSLPQKAKVVKCGRDCAYMVCRFLQEHREIRLENVDKAFGFEPVIEMIKLKQFLEGRGLFCRALLVKPDGFEEVAKAVGRRDAMAIVHRPSAGDQDGHYVLLWGASDSRVYFVDIALGRYDLEVGQLMPNGVAVLLVSADKSVQHLPESGGLVVATRMLASPLLLFSLLLAIGISAGTTSLLSPREMQTGQVLAQLRHWLTSISARLLRLAPLVVLGTITVAGPLLWFLAVRMNRDHEALTIEPAQLEFGMFAVGSQRMAAIRILNSTGQDEEIADVKVSCSCLKVDRTSFIVPVGGEAVVEVHATALLPGVTENSLLVVPKNPELKPMKVIVRHGGVEASKIVPIVLDLGEFPLGTPLERVVRLSVENIHSRKVSLKSVEFDAKLSWIKPEITGKALREDGSFDARMLCDGMGPKGLFRGSLTINGEFDGELLSFVVSVFGKMVDPLKFQPRSLLVNSSDGLDTAMSLTITSLTGPIEIESLSANPPMLRATVEKSSQEGREVLVSIIPTELPTETPFRAHVVISLKHPQAQQIKIPVFFTGN